MQNNNRANNTEVKITIAKLIELAYSKNKGLTAKIISSKGHFKLAVDTDGKTTLTGGTERLIFQGGTALTGLGVKVKKISILFSKGDNNIINYTGTFSFINATSISLSGSFDLEELITSCSGWLCQAARALKARRQLYDIELKKIMGY